MVGGLKLSDLLKDIPFFIVFVFFMAWGYFGKPTSTQETAFTLLLPLAIAAHAFFLAKLKINDLVISWFVYFFFFPKQPATEKIVDSLVAQIIPSIIESSFSFYYVVVCSFFFGLGFHAWRNRGNWNKKLLDGKLPIIAFVTFLIGALGMDFGDGDIIRGTITQMMLAVSALICLIKPVEKTVVNKVLGMSILFAIVLVFEYFSGRSFLLPDSVTYYIFNYRNSFRSIFVSSDLRVSLMAIMGAFSALYFYKKSEKKFFVFLFFLFTFVVIETYNRSSFFPYCLVVTAMALVSRHWKFPIAYYVVYFAILFPLSKELSTVYSEQLGRRVNFNYERVDGYLGTSSIEHRIGATTRGIDLLLTHPVLGVGPGRSMTKMSDSSIPKILGGKFQYGSYYYNEIINGKVRTNAHNFYVHLISEYGLSIVIFFATVILGFLKKVKLNFSQLREGVVNENFALICIVFTFLGFYAFQALPNILPTIILLVRAIDNDKSGSVN